MLRACRFVLRTGGRLALLTFQPTPRLSPSRRRKAHAVGPLGVAVRSSYPRLLQSAGFTEIVATDLTTDYRATQQRWLDASDRHAAALRGAVGDAEYERRLAGRHDTLRAIDDGLLSRFRYVAIR